MATKKKTELQQIADKLKLTEKSLQALQKSSKQSGKALIQMRKESDELKAVLMGIRGHLGNDNFQKLMVMVGHEDVVKMIPISVI